MYGKNEDVWSLHASVLKPLYFFIIIFTLSKIHFKLVKRARLMQKKIIYNNASGENVSLNVSY